MPHNATILHNCHAGSLVKAGQKLAVLSAMKMETAVQAPCDGLVRHVGVDKGDSLDAGKLLHAPAVCVMVVNPAYDQTPLHQPVHSSLMPALSAIFHV